MTMRLHSSTAAVAIGLFLAWQLGSEHALRASSSYDWCSNSCNSEQGCDVECENDGGGTTTCGEYQGGSSQWCDGDTCDENCGPFTPGSFQCYSAQNLTTCMSYGDYAHCGDDTCANITGAENCTTCPQDCGTCPDIECGDVSCDDHETWRNCPLDCVIPPNDFCGNGDCEPGEETGCDDCAAPREFCDEWYYICPQGWQCVGNQCVRESDLGDRQTCTQNSECSNNDRCVEATNPWNNDRVKVCVPWHLL